ncbi:hypothetical protein ACHQM5_002111 [Ranunculus cassubicifolius]
MESKIALIVTTIISLFLQSSSSIPRTSPHFSKIYAFGDSYTATNTKASLPYGITFFHHSSNRLSDGCLVIDFVAEALSLPYIPAYRDKKDPDISHGVNFAVAGATTLDHGFYVRNSITLRFESWYIRNELVCSAKFLKSHGCGKKNYRKKGAYTLMDDALFWIGQIGANDYAYTFGYSVSSAMVQDLAVKSVTSVLQGIPMTGCLSLAMTLALANDRDELGCVASANKQSYTHNLQLQSRLGDLRKKYPNAVISYADHWNAYRSIMKNHQGYGFEEPFKACCGTSTGPYKF